MYLIEKLFNFKKVQEIFIQNFVIVEIAKNSIINREI